MYHMRKMLSVIFLLFIILVSLLFSNIYNKSIFEGMETTSPSQETSEETTSPSQETSKETTSPSQETSKETTFPSQETSKETTFPSQETSEDNTSPSQEVTEETSEETSEETISPSQENFQTKLVGTPINNKNKQQTKNLNDSLRAKPETNGVFNHIFGFSKQQTFQVKQP
jgi:hypothetical protein